MPTYEYACTSCGNTWEEVQKISEPAVEVCPKCAQVTAKRQISGGSFILKGGGWYADLYASKPAAKGESKGDAPAAETKADTPKTESKSDAKAETKSAAPAASAATSSTPSTTKT